MGRRRGKVLYPTLPGGMLTAATTTLILDDCDVLSNHLADSAVTTIKINGGAVTAVKLNDTYIISGDCRVLTSHIQDSGVTTAKLNNTSVTYAKMQDVTALRLLGREDTLAGSPQEIALSAELRFDTNNDWLEIADSGILSGLIADSAVITAKMPDCAVTTLKLADSAVTAPKLYDTTILTRIIEIHATDTTLAVGDTVATFFVPIELNNYDLVRAEAAVKVASTAGTPTIQIRDVTGAADMLSTKITVDTAEKTSYTAVTASVIDTANDTLITGQEIAIDIDSAGNAEDLYVILSVRKP